MANPITDHDIIVQYNRENGTNFYNIKQVNEDKLKKAEAHKVGANDDETVGSSRFRATNFAVHNAPTKKQATKIALDAAKQRGIETAAIAAVAAAPYVLPVIANPATASTTAGAVAATGLDTAGLIGGLNQLNNYGNNRKNLTGKDTPGILLSGLSLLPGSSQLTNPRNLNIATNTIKEIPITLSISGRLPHWLSNTKIESKAIQKLTADGFKSQIDGTPNNGFSERVGNLITSDKDIRILNSHIPEYLNIEKQSKLNGTFLKNQDGTDGIGDPRSGIQLHSRKGSYLVPESFVTRVRHLSKENGVSKVGNFYKYNGRSWTTPLEQAEYFSQHALGKNAEPFEITYPKSAKTVTIDASGRFYMHIPKQNIPQVLLSKLDKNYISDTLQSDTIISLADKAKIPIVKINNVNEQLEMPVNDVVITGLRKSVVGNNGNFSRFGNRKNIYRKQGGTLKAQFGLTLPNPSDPNTDLVGNQATYVPKNQRPLTLDELRKNILWRFNYNNNRTVNNRPKAIGIIAPPAYRKHAKIVEDGGEF